MGWSFRKSIKCGPFRLNLSKSGVGVSTGVKGARISVGPKGTRVYGGWGPFRYQKQISGGTKSRSRFSGSQPRAAGCGGCLLIGLIGFCCLACLGVLTKPPPSNKSTSPTGSSVQFTSNTERPGTSRQPQRSNSEPVAELVFDVPSLLGKNIDDIVATLGVFASTVDEPFSEHADTEHRKSFNASGRTLIVAYDPKTGQSTSFFLPGTDPRSLLRIGNLTWAGDYDLEFLRQTGGSTPGLKVVLPTSTVTEESEIQNAKERPVRTWTDAAGNHQIKAAFGGCAFGAVKLTKMSGETITLRVDQLSEKDQEWIHKRIGRK